MIVKINDNFTEQGLTLEEAYILARVRYYEDEELQYYESNETIAKIIGKSISTVRRAVDSLVNKGYLNKKVLGRRRILSINSVHNEQLLEGHIERYSAHNEHHNAHNEHHEEDEPKETNRMSDEELMAEFTNGIERLKKLRMESELEND